MKILGIDEAGRGPVIGPLVIAGALIDKDNVKKLKQIGVKDSKLIPKEKREDLFHEIKKLVKYKVIEISPEEIDQRYNVNTNLNQLEALKFAEIINELKPDIAIIDTPTKNTKAFKNYLKKFLTHNCRLLCENYADLNHVEVGAASIIAKVIRDKRIEEIKKEVGEEIGAGYPSDEITLKFVEKALKDKSLRKYIRKSWYTYQKIKAEKEQTKLSGW
ncbi:MAG: ribonuclease HII [Nanoarchaeota archaeon]|nr:ribonuclease HII [Nanoarchaeota archaeon]